MKKKLILTFVTILFLLTACQEYEPESIYQSYGFDNENQNNIENTPFIKAVIICREHPLHIEDAAAWQDALVEYGINSTVITEEKLKKSSFKGIDLIIVGTGRIERSRFEYETLENGSIRSKFIEPDKDYITDSWKDSGIVKMISESGLPIIGIGKTGCNLFYDFDPPIHAGYFSYSSSEENSFSFTEYGQKYTKEPLMINEKEIKVSNHEKNVLLYKYPPLSFECILKEVGHLGNYSLVRFQLYVSWCCGRDIRKFSATQKKLFANIAYSLVKDYREKKYTDWKSALQENNYNNALDYYNLFCVNKLNLFELEKDEYTEEESHLYLKATRLLWCYKEWDSETPDTVVSTKDKEDIEKIITQSFPNPRKWEKLEIKFYGGNRCHVDIIWYDKGPMHASGYDIYLIKYKDKWEIITRGDWIS